MTANREEENTINEGILIIKWFLVIGFNPYFTIIIIYTIVL